MRDLRSVLLEVEDSAVKEGGIVLEVAETEITGTAEKTTNVACCVVMIDGQPLIRFGLSLTNGAQAVLIL